MGYKRAPVVYEAFTPPRPRDAPSTYDPGEAMNTLWTAAEIALLLSCAYLAMRLFSIKRRASLQCASVGERSLRRSKERLARLNHLQDELLLPDAVAPKFQKICDAAVELLQLECCRIWTKGPADQCAIACVRSPMDDSDACSPDGNHCLHLSATSGAINVRDDMERMRLPLHCSTAERLDRSPHAALVENDLLNSDLLADRDWAERHGLRSFFGQRLIDQDNNLTGVVTCFSRRRLTSEDVTFLSSLARTTTNVIINDLAHERMEDAIRAAEDANESKSRFLANMSHEIRTPLTAILGFADMLHAQLDDPETKSAAETIRRNGQYLLSMINDILDLSKVEAGCLRIHAQTARLPAILADVQSLMRVRALERGLTFRVESEGPIPETIRTDPLRLKQILLNLVGNAVKFTEHGEVRIVVDMEPIAGDGSLRICVIDSGIGIPAHVIPKLFRPFEQGDGVTDHRFAGTGLGLAISKRLTEMLGGSLACESEVGHGSTFTLRLPAACVDSDSMIDGLDVGEIAIHDAELPPSPGRLRGVRLLLAEDGLDNQRLISFILRKAGADVDVVQDGQQAIDAVMEANSSDRPLDCVLMDMQMPVLDGYEATRQLRDLGCATPIIALTAHAMAGAREKCLEAGCSDYATKPIDREELLNTIQRCLPAWPGLRNELQSPAGVFHDAL